MFVVSGLLSGQYFVFSHFTLHHIVLALKATDVFSLDDLGGRV